MTRFSLIARSLRFHWRSHLGVVLGAAVGSAALIGALIVGDSVRETLRQRALERLGPFHFAMDTGDRLFETDLAKRLEGQLGAHLFIRLNAPGRAVTNRIVEITDLLHSVGTASTADGTARANAVSVFGVDASFSKLASEAVSGISAEEVIVNEPLASHLKLKVGDPVILRVPKANLVSPETPVATGGSGAALRLRVKRIVTAAESGNLSLRANQVPPYNVFVSLDLLQKQMEARGRANWLLATAVGNSVSSSPALSWWEQRLRKAKNMILRQSPAGAGSTTNDLPDAAAADLLPAAVPSAVTAEDFQLQFQWMNRFGGIDIRSPRIFIEPAIGDTFRTMSAAQFGIPVGGSYSNPVSSLTYLVNQFRSGTNTTPYSMVTATDSPLLPADLKEDEIVVTEWLADDLKLQPGAEIALEYFLPDEASQLIERTNVFRVRAIIPMTNALCDRTLMPDFPGVAKAESPGDWETSFPLVHKIRPQDDAYWKKYRGTPKGFVKLAAGQNMWANRFGNVTSIRFHLDEAGSDAVATQRMTSLEKGLRDAFSSALKSAPKALPRLDAAAFGFSIRPVRLEALNAAAQSQDFGGLFIGFSFFLIIAALILMALLFQFGVEQRVTEIGTLLAVGFRPARVRRMFLIEGAALALLGGLLGTAGGIFYARLMLRGLTTIWSSATNTTALAFHLSASTVGAGVFGGVLVAVLTIWIVLRRQARQPARVLLFGEAAPPGSAKAPPQRLTLSGRIGTISGKVLRAPVIAWATFLLAMATVASAFATHETANPEYFFSAGSFCLISGLAFTSWMLRRFVSGGGMRHVSRRSLSTRGAARRRNRSVATVALLASGAFLIVAVGAFRLDANADAWKRSSGTGGFALIGESALPIVKDLNTPAGREALGLDEKAMEGVTFVPLRVKEGDEASCLNLNRAQRPRILGVRPEFLVSRFSFAGKPKVKAIGAVDWDPWQALRSSGLRLTGASTSPSIIDPAVPAVGDAASIQWALGKKVGEVLPYNDEHGQEMKLRLVGSLANSVLQGSLIVDESALKQHFPGVSGYRMFLIDCPSNALPQVSAELSRALQDYGFEVTPAAERLAAFNAVQNTYLKTFQVLGGLGLLLGSAGLGIVVLRNVLERRGELALLLAVGFRRARVQRLVLGEHAGLLCLGLLVGVASAGIAILPGLLSPRGEFPLLSLLITLGGVLLFGVLSTWLATCVAVRGDLLEGLRNE